jgi:hypothetical protein
MPLYNNILTVLGTAITALGTSLAIGATGAAGSGALRVANNISALSARNAAGSGDLSLIGSDGANNVTVGDANTTAVLHGCASIGWGTGITGPTLTQVAALSGATPQSLTLTPQTFNSGSTTAVTNTPGSVVVALAAPGSNTVAGAEAYFQVSRGSNAVAYVGALTGGSTASAFYLSGATGSAFTPTVSNYILEGNGSVNTLNGPSHVYLAITGTAIASVHIGGTQLGSSTPSFSGGALVVGVNNATTVPGTLFASGTGLVFYSNAGAFELNGAAFQFNALVQSPAITQIAAASGVTPTSLNITPQTFNAGSTTAVANTPGSVIVNLAVPGSNTNAGAEAQIIVKRGAATVAALGPSGATSTALWLFASGTTPTASNPVLVNTGNLYVCATGGANILLRPNSNTVVGPFILSQNGLQLGSETIAFGGGVKVVGLTNATTIPTSLISGPTGLVFYSNAGAFELNGAAYQFNALVASPTVTQPALASTSAGSGAAGQYLYITAQAGQAATGAGNNGGNGANVVIAAGAGGTSGAATAGTTGYVTITGGAAAASALVLQQLSTYPALQMKNAAGTIYQYFGYYAANSEVQFNSVNSLPFNMYTSNVLRLSIGSAGTIRLTTDVQFGTTIALGGGVGVVGVSNANTVPTALVASGTGLVWYANNGALETTATAFQFNTLVQSPALTQAAAASGVTPTSLFITPQTFNSGSTTAVANTPGNVVVSLAVPGSNTVAGAEALFQIQRGGVTVASFGPLPGTPTTFAMYASGTPTASNWILDSQGANTALQGTTRVLHAINGSFLFNQLSTGIQLFASLGANFGGGTNILSMGNAATDPSTAPTAGASIWWSSLTVGASKQRTSSGWTKTTCGNTSTTVSSQKLVYDELLATGQITAAGGTLTLNIPLLTSNSGVRIDCEIDAKVVTAGTLVAVGDSYSTRLLVKYQNVGGTPSIPGAGSPVALDSFANTHLSTSTVTFTVSGTNIVVTLTLNPTTGTLPAADCTILARCFYN